VSGFGPGIWTNMGMLEEPARVKGLHLSCHVDTLPGALLADATRLTQAFLNLANNAVKFTEVGVVSLAVTSTPLAGGLPAAGPGAWHRLR